MYFTSMKYNYTFVSTHNKIIDEYKDKFIEINHNIIDKTLDTLYTNHPEIKMINTVINIEPNGKYDSYALFTDFSVIIRNQNNKKIRITCKWNANKVCGLKIYSFDFSPTLYPKMVCLENNWYSLDKANIMDIALEYNHEGIIVENILKQNKELKTTLDEEMKTNIYLINKNKQLGKHNKILCVCSFVLLGLYVYNAYFK